LSRAATDRASRDATIIRGRSPYGWRGGVKRGITLRRTDALGYNIVEDPVEVHDLHATILHLMGLDHERLTYRFQGREFRLTDVSGEVVNKLLA